MFDLMQFNGSFVYPTNSQCTSINRCTNGSDQLVEKRVKDAHVTITLIPVSSHCGVLIRNNLDL